MANGGGGYIVADSDYQTIKSGVLVLRGTYAGCVQVVGTYYWISLPDSGSYWDLNSGVPDETQVKITSSVWDLCKDGGDYDWVSKDEWWNDPVGGENYRWADNRGSTVLVEV